MYCESRPQSPAQAQESGDMRLASLSSHFIDPGQGAFPVDWYHAFDRLEKAKRDVAEVKARLELKEMEFAALCNGGVSTSYDVCSQLHVQLPSHVPLDQSHLSNGARASDYRGLASSNQGGASSSSQGGVSNGSDQFRLNQS
ncbi:hypothetical protein SeLEV6574_g00411 [Synchytrium endobioticum]|uniref:Uncharacterized protein n=1 Tax=Synchytrium endobioticum TaxID=286115 RepID=A0A507DI34_9FUNG|nr:hypothetical protein SeLEV6574_g00411 [Synchytrium endobioticum]